MVQFIPARNTYSEIGEGFGGSLASGYTNRSDENAIRKSIEGLGHNASARQILDAITNTKTYNPKAKQGVLENYLGVEKFEELKRQAQETESINREKNRIAKESNDLKRNLEELDQSKKTQREIDDSLLLVDHSNLDQAKKDALREKIRNGGASYQVIKDILKPEKQKTDKGEEKKASLESAITTLDRMDELGKAGRLGIGSGIKGLVDSDTARDSAEYSRLGKSLIALSTTIPIRNRQEFEVLAHDLYDPTMRDASREGIIKAMRKIISDSLSNGGEDHSNSRGKDETKDSKGRPPLSSFHR